MWYNIYRDETGFQIVYANLLKGGFAIQLQLILFKKA